MKREIVFNKLLDINSQQAIEIVRNFDDYSNFIPGCKSSKLIERNHPVEIGKLEFNLLGKIYYIVSKNILTKDSVKITQIDGPFNYFKGAWVVEGVDNDSCNINFFAEFELPFLLDALAPQSLVNTFSKNIMDSFIKKAV